MDDDFSQYAIKGVWPGPDETAQQYKERAAQTLSSIAWPLKAEAIIAAEKRLQTTLKSALPKIDLHFSQQGLMPWEGGALFLYPQEGCPSACLQLRKELQKGSLFFYSLHEVLCHECVHALRVMYDCPKYEEILAYRMSDNRARRIFGALLQSPSDVYIFLVAVLACSICSFWFFLLPWAIVALTLSFFMFRLLSRHATLQRAMKNVVSLLQDPLDSFAFIARLTDQEIDMFARSKPHIIAAYLQKQSSNEIRISLLVKEFLLPYKMKST